jgi:hypothetical protein
MGRSPGRLACGVALAALLVSCGGGTKSLNTPGSIRDGSPAEGPAATATNTPAGGNLPTTVPRPVSAPSVVAGKPVKELVIGPVVEFPDDTVMYVATSGCANCGFAPGNLWRIYRARSGELVADHVSPDGYVPLYALSPDASLLIAGVCTGYCGGEGYPSEDASLRFVVSHDGGITWQPLQGPKFDRTYVIFGGWYRGQVVANAISYLPNNRVARVETFLLPSFERLTPPPNLPAPSPDRFPFTAMAGPGGSLLWTTPRPSLPPLLFDERGNPASLSGLEAVIPGMEWQDRTYGNPNPNGSEVWFAIGDAVGAPSFYVQLDSAGVPRAAFATSLQGVTFAARVSETEWLGTAVLPLGAGESAIGGNDNFRAVLIDTATGLMHPIRGLPRDASPLPGNFAWPRLAIKGKFLRVETGSDCLNVRESASTGSRSLGCYASGVLLRQREANAPAGWQPVLTPGGRPGFASSQYLR